METEADSDFLDFLSHAVSTGLFQTAYFSINLPTDALCNTFMDLLELL